MLTYVGLLKFTSEGTQPVFKFTVCMWLERFFYSFFFLIEGVFGSRTAKFKAALINILILMVGQNSVCNVTSNASRDSPTVNHHSALQLCGAFDHLSAHCVGFTVDWRSCRCAAVEASTEWSGRQPFLSRSDWSLHVQWEPLSLQFQLLLLFFVFSEKTTCCFASRHCWTLRRSLHAQSAKVKNLLKVFQIGCQGAHSSHPCIHCLCYTSSWRQIPQGHEGSYVLW